MTKARTNNKNDPRETRVVKAKATHVWNEAWRLVRQQPRKAQEKDAKRNGETTSTCPRIETACLIAKNVRKTKSESSNNERASKSKLDLAEAHEKANTKWQHRNAK